MSKCFSVNPHSVPPKKPIIFIGTDRLYPKTQPIVNESAPLTLLCEVIGGSPPPRVSWYLGDKMLDDTYRREPEQITVNNLEIARVTRDFATSKVICRASNTHLISPTASEILLDVNCTYSGSESKRWVLVLHEKRIGKVDFCFKTKV